MNVLPGIGGTLFPGHFLASKAGPWTQIQDPRTATARRHFVRWWERVSATCGPATGMRALFDVVAMPLASLLGYQARGAVFERDRIRAKLVGGPPGAIDLVVLPWASRPSRRMSREDSRAAWLMTVAPPFVSV